MWQAGVEMEGRRVDTLPLKQGESVVGRSRTCDLQVNVPDISRAHARIVATANGVTIENLGKTGTKLNGQPIEGACAWNAGERVAMGSMAELVLERNDESAPVAETPPSVVSENNADRTADEPLAQQTQAERFAATAADARTGPASGAGPNETRLSMPGQNGDGHTRAMQTRMVSPEELEILRDGEQKKGRKRLALGIVVALTLLAAALVLRPRALPPETEIQWPRDARNNPVETAVPAPGGGFNDGGCDVLVPGSDAKSVARTADGLVIETRVGRAADVPLRLVLNERADPRYARMGRDTLIAEWMKEQAEDGHTWTFDRPYTQLGFYGVDQGVPFTRIPYRRHDGQTSWHGMAALFRHGRRRFAMLAEIPASERLRAERMLFMRYVKPAPAFERSHWETGSAALDPASLSDMLAGARRDLNRKAPLTWVRVETQLQAALAKAADADDAAAYTEAMDLLAGLREQQTRWYNSQLLARDDARAQGDDDRARRIAELAKAVFSNPEDRRYYQVRRW